MMGMSAAAKNLFGAIPGTLKPEYHFRFPDPRDFARMIVDLDEYFHPILSLADAVVAMEGNGPTQGTPRPMGALLASPSPHKLDLACAWLIGLERSLVPTLEAALERNLIPPHVQDLHIAGDLSAFRVPDFQKLETPSSLLFRGRRGTGWGRIQGAVIQKLLSARPEASAQCMRRLVSGQSHHHGAGPPRHPPQPVHSLLLLSGILPGGRHGGASDCHCQNVESIGNCHETDCIF